MKKARLLLVWGVWMAVLPFLGFPYSWKDILMSVSGIGIIYFGYVIYKESETRKAKKEVFDNFSENI